MSKLSIEVSSRDHVQGDPGAQWTLVEYGDYQCPSCGQAQPLIKRWQKHFGKQLAFVFRNFPLNQIHPFAEAAAETAEFAAAHSRFWEMHDLLFDHQDRLGDELLIELTESLKLPASELREALQNSSFGARVKADFAGGVRSGVNGTPTFFLNGNRYDGPVDFRSVVDAIEQTADVQRTSSSKEHN